MTIDVDPGQRAAVIDGGGCMREFGQREPGNLRGNLSLGEKRHGGPPKIVQGVGQGVLFQAGSKLHDKWKYVKTCRGGSCVGVHPLSINMGLTFVVHLQHLIAVPCQYI